MTRLIILTVIGGAFLLIATAGSCTSDPDAPCGKPQDLWPHAVTVKDGTDYYAEQVISSGDNWLLLDACWQRNEPSGWNRFWGDDNWNSGPLNSMAVPKSSVTALDALKGVK